MKGNYERVAGLKMSRHGGLDGGQRTGDRISPTQFKVHSVSVYFSALRKIEKKGKTKNIGTLKCSLMRAFTAGGSETLCLGPSTLKLSTRRYK